MNNHLKSKPGTIFGPYWCDFNNIRDAGIQFAVKNKDNSWKFFFDSWDKAGETFYTAKKYAETQI